MKKLTKFFASMILTIPLFSACGDTDGGNISLYGPAPSSNTDEEQPCLYGPAPNCTSQSDCDSYAEAWNYSGKYYCAIADGASEGLCELDSTTDAGSDK